MPGGISLSWGVLASMVAVAGAAFSVGAMVQRFRETREDIVEGHKHMHKDLETFANDINGHDHINRESCPICKDDIGDP